MTSRTRGFTLIELLVVIAIIGILSSVVLASLNSARQKGRDSRRIADIKQLQLAMELYYDSCSTYPSSLVTTASAGCPTGTTLASFIATIPNDPQNSAWAYGYVPSPTGCDGSTTKCTGYTIGTQLETAGHSALAADYDTAQAITLRGAAADCATNAGNPGPSEVIFCAKP